MTLKQCCIHSTVRHLNTFRPYGFPLFCTAIVYTKIIFESIIGGSFSKAFDINLFKNLNVFEIFGEVFITCLKMHCIYWKEKTCEIKDFEKAVAHVENELFHKQRLSKSKLETSVKDSGGTEIIFSNIGGNRVRRSSSTATLMSFIGNLCKNKRSYKAK
jgi:hypothetical protein